jgi:hypothetical protein
MAVPARVVHFLLLLLQQPMNTPPRHVECAILAAAGEMYLFEPWIVTVKRVTGGYVIRIPIPVNLAPESLNMGRHLTSNNE